MRSVGWRRTAPMGEAALGAPAPTAGLAMRGAMLHPAERPTATASADLRIEGRIMGHQVDEGARDTRWGSDGFRWRRVGGYGLRVNSSLPSTLNPQPVALSPRHSPRVQ